MHKYSFLFLLLISLLSCRPAENSSGPEESQPDSRPNMIIILTDDQGYGDLTSYGAPDLQTPNMDELVASGMRFDNFYANCPVCSPTRAAIMSGRYPEFVGVPGVIRTYEDDNWGYLDTEAVLLPEILSENGYHTALVGKWHLGLETPNTPNERGFKLFHGWLGDMMDDYVKKRRHDINYMRHNEAEVDPPGHATDIFTQWTIDYLHERKDQPEPFFLYLAYNAPHFPVQPPQEWVDKVLAREGNIDPKRARLVAFIEHLDNGIGQVIRTLKETGQYDNTIIAFTSDNGGLLRDGANNGPLRDGKQSVYEGGIKVPAAVVWPGRIAAGSRSHTRFLTMDLYPTLLEAAGISFDHPIEGISFLPTLSGQTQDTEDRPVFFTRREGNMRYGGKTIEAVRLGDWKLLQNSPFAPRELYNLREDPLEENDLTEAEPEKFRELNKLLMKHIQQGGRIPWQKPE